MRLRKGGLFHIFVLLVAVVVLFVVYLFGGGEL